MQSTKPFLKEQIKRLSGLANPLTDEFAVAAFREQCERILANVGEERFAAGVASCVRAGGFFPDIPRLERMIPPPRGQNRCPRCIGNEGFEYCEVQSAEGRVSKGVRKCTHS